jgi:hypothetical protein
VINKSFLLKETLAELVSYQTIGVMRNATKQIMAAAQQKTNARLQLPLLAAVIDSDLVTPYAVHLTKAQVTLSARYMYFEVYSRGECREPENTLFLVCPQTGGPTNAAAMADAYRSACAADMEHPQAAGVAAARAIAMRPAASSEGAQSDAQFVCPDCADDHGLAPEVPGGWHVASVIKCSCQLRVHHG